MNLKVVMLILCGLVSACAQHNADNSSETSLDTSTAKELLPSGEPENPPGEGLKVLSDVVFTPTMQFCANSNYALGPLTRATAQNATNLHVHLTYQDFSPPLYPQFTHELKCKTVPGHQALRDQLLNRQSIVLKGCDLAAGLAPGKTRMFAVGLITYLPGATITPFQPGGPALGIGQSEKFYLHKGKVFSGDSMDPNQPDLAVNPLSSPPTLGGSFWRETLPMANTGLREDECPN